MSVRRQPSLERLLEDIDWSRCSGRDLHRLAEGAAQAAMRGEGGRPGGTAYPVENLLKILMFVKRCERPVY